MNKEVFDIFESIKNTSSRLEKESILKEHSDNELFKKALSFLLNPYIVTNIAKAKIKKFNKTENKIFDFEDYIDFLSNRVNGTQKSVDLVMAFINECDKEFHEFLIALATKSYKMGLTAKTVNKIYGKGFISTFDVQLAEAYKKEPINDEFILTTKLNGCRMLAIVESGKVNLFSRQGKPMDGFNEIVNELKAYPNGVYDGEILAIGEFKDSDAQYKETIKRSRIKGKKTGLKFIMYDFIELDEFKEGNSTIPCKERKRKLQELTLDYCDRFTEYLYPLYVGANETIIMPLCEDQTNNGEEGIMINKASSPYQFKRSKDILKVKLFSEGDVLVTELLAGEGKLSNTLGKVRISFNYNGQACSCFLGSGFTEEERDYYWNNQDKLLNKIVVVKYKAITSNAYGGYGLNFPVWQGIIRDDKSGIEETNIE